jgi:hypothetical protein
LLSLAGANVGIFIGFLGILWVSFWFFQNSFLRDKKSAVFIATLMRKSILYLSSQHKAHHFTICKMMGFF